MNESFLNCETVSQLLTEYRKELDADSNNIIGSCRAGSAAWTLQMIDSLTRTQQLSNAVIARLLELSAAKEPQK